MANELTALADKFAAAQGEPLRKAKRKALRAVGDKMLAAVKMRAPLKAEGNGGLLERGELRSSYKETISVATDTSTLSGRGDRAVVAPEGHEANLVANWVENGHVARRSKRRAGPPKFVPAQPFVRPAWDAIADQLPTLYTETLSAELSKALE